MIAKPMTRRSALQFSAASALGLGAACSAPTKRKYNSLGLDLTRPEDNVYAIVKIQGDVSGKTTYSWGLGHIYGVKDGAMAKPMLQYQLARVGRYEKQDDESFLYRYRGMIFYQDYDTGAFIDEFLNPYTNEVVKVKHYKSSIGQYSYTLAGVKSAGTFEANWGKKPSGSYILPWVRNGNLLTVMLDERVEYQRPSDGAWRRDNAILRYQSAWDEVDNADLTMAMASSTFQTHIEWFTWLNMAKHSGGLMQGGTGYKYSSIDELPNDFVEFAETRYPGCLKDSII